MDNMAWRTSIMSALSDDAFVDFHLVGTDNVEVRCIKLLLAMQSPVFKAMFFGGFKEQECYRTQLDYHSSIIHVLVNYCHSGDIALHSILSGNETMTNAEIKLLMDLREAGRYFQLDDVSVHAEKELGDAVFRKKDTGGVCAALLEELLSRGEDSGPFWDAIFQFALEKPLKCFGWKSNDDGSYRYRASKIPNSQLLLRVLEKLSDTYLLVQCLQAWSTHEGISTDTSATEKEALVAISKRVDLKELSKLQLTKVKPCPFFPLEKLHEACVHHLSRSKRTGERSSTFSTLTKLYVTGAGTQGVDGHYFYDEYRNGYVKEEEFGGIACKYKICSGSDNAKWRLSVVTEVDSSGENSPVHIYEASSASDGKVPFTGWKCLKGTGQAPFVAPISTRKESSPGMVAPRRPLLPSFSADEFGRPPFPLPPQQLRAHLIRFYSGTQD